MPALLRAARGAYATEVTKALVDAGCDDVPRNGAFVIGGIAGSSAALSELIAQLRTSKQAAGQLVDALVARGYLDRQPDPTDRRRLTVRLTPRGRAAADVIRSAVAKVDTALVRRVGATHVAHARAVLAALTEMGSQA
jgi:DNA-binding MarR family transcriptional regulator